MSSLHNDNGFLEKKNPMSMKEILAERGTYIARNKTQSVATVGWKELLVQYPPVKTEVDVDIAADILVRIFNSPKSRRFYCDCARHLDRDIITQAVYYALQTRTRKPIINPPAYFGRICVKKLEKLGIY